MVTGMQSENGFGNSLLPINTCPCKTRVCRGFNVANLCHNSNWFFFYIYICWSTKHPAVSWHQDVQTLGGKKCWHSVQGFLQLIKVHHLCQKTGWTCWLQHRSEQPNIPPIPQSIKTHETFFFNFISPWVELAVPLKPLFNLTCFSRLDMTDRNSPECLMRL